MRLKTILCLLVVTVPLFLPAQSRDSLSIKIGQMILMGLPTNFVDTNSQFFEEVRQGKIGGITLYEKHLTPDNTAENLKTLIAAYQQSASLPRRVVS